MLQLSVEMYDYAPNGDLHMEVLLNDFVRKVLDKWKSLDVSHYLTVVLFSRTFFHTKEVSDRTITSFVFARSCSCHLSLFLLFSEYRECRHDDIAGLETTRHCYPGLQGTCAPACFCVFMLFCVALLPHATRRHMADDQGSRELRS